MYPALIPPKSGPADFGRVVTEGEARKRGRVRDEDGQAETLSNESIDTIQVALKADRYRPRMFGFQVNEIAKLQRWQEAVRDR